MQKSLTFVISGEAGQGLQTLEDLLVQAASVQYHIFSTSEVMSRVRGGNNSLTLRISEVPVYSYRQEIDILFLLNDHALSRLAQRITANTRFVKQESLFIDADEAKGGALTLNARIFGFISGMLKLDQADCQKLILNHFAALTSEKLKANIDAMVSGFEQGRTYWPEFSLNPSASAKAHKVLDGSHAVGIGALGGGCNFVAAYPMSPGTGLLTFMAKNAKSQGVLVEQAEDEISALNMVIGAWYAGARAMTTTSGGGFALMQEAVSLAAMTETPCVIHVGQRPGPATGMPTRTEQADLNLVVYSGHGEFPRIVLAPGSLEDGVLLSQKAFYLADRYQIPVFILTDQFYLDSTGQIKDLTLEEGYLEQHIVKTDKGYQRYKLNASGISPRGIPGNGAGIVRADSDEHDENGRITEDFDLRIQMNDKRLRKEKQLLEDYENPELIGPKDYAHLLIGWGSSYGVLKEYVLSGKRKDIAFLNIKQVYPLSSGLLSYFEQARSITVIEGNATGQLSDLLSLRLGVRIGHRILKYSGEPFSIEEIELRLSEVLL